MKTKKDFLKEINSKPILFDGAMGTEIYKRGVFINKCYDEFRRTSRHPSIPLTPTFDGEEMEDWGWLRDPSPSLQSQIEADELSDALQRCLASLPFVHRSVLALVDVDGFTYEETAATLQIPVGTVKSRLARARAAMRAALNNVSDLLPSAYQNFHAVPA